MPFHPGSASTSPIPSGPPSARAICLLSGGPDGLLAAELVKRSGFRLSALTVDYGQRTARKELACARRSARWLGVTDHRVTELRWLRDLGARTGLTATAPRVDGSRPGSEYVPFRNTILLSLAVAWAEVVGAGAVVIGSTGAGSTTPDNSSDYIAAMQNVVALGTRSSDDIRVLAPLAVVSKAESTRRGLELRIPFEDTWSCHNDTAPACGTCVNCVARLKAFSAAGATDPLIYAHRLAQ